MYRLFTNRLNLLRSNNIFHHFFLLRRIFIIQTPQRPQRQSFTLINTNIPTATTTKLFKQLPLLNKKRLVKMIFFRMLTKEQLHHVHELPFITIDNLLIAYF